MYQEAQQKAKAKNEWIRTFKESNQAQQQKIRVIYERFSERHCISTVPL